MGRLVRVSNLLPTWGMWSGVSVRVMRLTMLNFGILMWGAESGSTLQQSHVYTLHERFFLSSFLTTATGKLEVALTAKAMPKL